MNRDQFDSTEEFMVYLYLCELQSEGFIDKIIPQVSYNLFNGFWINYDKHLITKVKSIPKKIINSRIYTLDFEVHWTEKAKDIFITNLTKFNNKSFFWTFGDNVSHLEVKGSTFDLQSSTRLFNSRTQPMMFSEFGIYVQLIKPLDLFKNTFIPKSIEEFMYYKINTKKNKVGDKKYSFNYRTLNEYLNQQFK